MVAAQPARPLWDPELLGTEAESELDFVRSVEEGLPAAALDRLQALAELTETEMDEIIPRRTRTHQRRRGRLSPDQSDRVARAARAFAQAHETFASREKGNRWMRKPNRALGGEAPLSLLRTGSGTRLVETILTRIAHGVHG